MMRSIPADKTSKDKRLGNFEQERNNYFKPVLLLIAILAIGRFFLASFLELGNDEAYYWVYSLYPQWNYFDHPPMVAVWIRIFTANLALQDYEGFLRLGSVVGGVLASLFLYKATSLIHSQRAGWYVVILYSASFYAAITAGLYILPDAPQMVFWTFSMWMIARIINAENRWTNWILFGIGAGLCMMSKVHGVFVWMGLGAYILFFQRSWLKKPQLYIAALLTVLIISPIFLWNLKYDFVTYRFHTSRVEINDVGINWFSLLKEIASQAFFNNPVNFFLVVAGLVTWRKKKIPSSRALMIYILSGLPLAIILLLISIFRNSTLPHWSGPAYVTLLPLAAVYLAETRHSFFPTVLKWTLALLVIVYTGWSAIVHFYPGTWGSKEEKNLGYGDISLDMYGWEKASGEFSEFYKKEVDQGIMPAGAPLVSTHWWGSHGEYYFARPLRIPLIALGETHRYMGQYLWINNVRTRNMKFVDAYCIIPSDEHHGVPSSYFTKTELATVIPIYRNGKPAHNFRVYRMRGLKKEVPEVE